MEKKEIFIVGGGSSLVDFDFSKLKNKNTIAVNMSVFDVPSPNYFISVDYTFLKKIGRNIGPFRCIKTTKIFVVDLHFRYLEEKYGQIIDVRNGLTYDLKDFDVVIKARRCEGIGYNYNDFRTGLNTGYCALQLAIILGYKKIYLLGIDLTQGKTTHYHNGYGENSDRFNIKVLEYLDYFRKGLEQIRK